MRSSCFSTSDVVGVGVVVGRGLSVGVGALGVGRRDSDAARDELV